jgi:hypothetical protein
MSRRITKFRGKAHADREQIKGDLHCVGYATLPYRRYHCHWPDSFADLVESLIHRHGCHRYLSMQRNMKERWNSAMASDYARIRRDNERRYGTDIGRIGKMLLADRYDDRTHFIFELLQNAEDALADRKGWTGKRAVRFMLSQDTLTFSHYGRPFHDANVRGICGIDESTKDRNAIGRFGIGFKSVYAYTNRPEVHSGDEAFAIESYVWPTPVDPWTRHADETVFRLPLNAGIKGGRDEIAQGLQRLGPKALLFLREIEEIEWQVEGAASGIYIRSKRAPLDSGVMRVTVLGQQTNAEEIEESWLIFFRDVTAENGDVVGQIEIAFSTDYDTESDKWSIQSLASSPLVVFFPTVVLTQLGFLLQGPYRTTPSRDNIPKGHPWNQHLVKETSNLLTDAMIWLRDKGLLNVQSLRCLPLERTRFPEGSMFAPLFEAVRARLIADRLLPGSDPGYVTATSARMARTHELRALFSPTQLGALLGAPGPIEWVSGDISQDRTPDVRQYLMRELEIVEVTPEMVLPRLSKQFLEVQTDAWIQRLYEFFQGQPALVRSGRLQGLPVVRLAGGTHVVPHANGQPCAFLPSAIESGFPTVQRAVCGSPDARKFLESLGLTEPDPVDDVVWNVLPRYRKYKVDVTDDEYVGDIRRILDAFRTDSKAQREKLLHALRDTAFVMTVAAQDGKEYMSQPDAVYLATARLKELFAGAKDVLVVDDGYDCLRGEEVRELLEACGAARVLLPVVVDAELSWQQKHDLRVEGGCESTSGGESISDYGIRGLNEVLELMPSLKPSDRIKRAALIWDALVELEDRRGTSWFTAKYEWTYYLRRSATFPAKFVRQLNETAWVPSSDGTLHRPAEVVFKVLGWKADPFLESAIRFKPPIIEQLAKEAGIDPGVLDLLKRLGLTSEEELRRRLGVHAEDNKEEVEGGRVTGDDAASGDSKGEQDATRDSEGEGEDADTGGRDGQHQNHGSGGGDSSSADDKQRSRSNSGGGDGEREGCGSHPFISYIGTHPLEDEYENDPDRLDREARMALEAKAIELILRIEPELQCTKANNPGFDLYEAGANERPIRWVEVKAMTGSLNDRPVCMSRTQFDCAWLNGEAYWLYVVEHASDLLKTRVVKVNDPAGKAKNFTFDKGWSLVAEIICPKRPPN